MDQSKRCSRCGETKPVSDFPRNREKKDGLHSRCRVCANEASRAWHDKNRERSRYLSRRTQLRLYYGLSLEDYDRLVEQQDGKCGICGTTDPGGSGTRGNLHVDHDHRTGRVRGLLCAVCNVQVGVLEKFRNDPELLAVVDEWLAADRDGRSTRELF